MKHPTSRELYQYWSLMRGDEAAPLRSAIEPSDIRGILADTFIAEVAEGDVYRVRLAGTRVCALYGREIKGTNLLDFWTAEDRSALSTLAAAVSEDGAAALVSAAVRTAGGEEATCELLLLPLRHGPGKFDRMLGSMAPIERPFWLGSDPVVTQRINSLRLIWPDENPGFMRRKTDRSSEIRAAAAAAAMPARSGRRRGHLYIVDGGKD